MKIQCHYISEYMGVLLTATLLDPLFYLFIDTFGFVTNIAYLFVADCSFVLPIVSTVIVDYL